MSLKSRGAFKALMLPVVLSLVGLAAGTASATQTITLDYEFSGGTLPSGDVVLTFANSGADTVTLTIDLTALAVGEFMDDLYLNFNPAKIGSVGSLVFTYAGGTGPAATGVSLGNDAFKADGDGFYDIVLDFPPPPGNDKFNGGETVVYTITGVSGLVETDFVFRSTSDKGNFLAAAHIQGIGPGGNLSGWVGDQDGAPPGPVVPEPSTLAMALVSLASLGFVQLRKRRRSHASA